MNFISKLRKDLALADSSRGAGGGPPQHIRIKHVYWDVEAWAYEQTFFPSAKKIFPFSNPNPFPFEPKETKIRKDNFSEMKEREESSSIFIVW